jgi:hypothetical protein
MICFFFGFSLSYYQTLLAPPLHAQHVFDCMFRPIWSSSVA